MTQTFVQPDRDVPPALCHAEGPLVMDAEGACYLDCTGTLPPADEAMRRRIRTTISHGVAVGDSGRSLQIQLASDEPILAALRDHGVLANQTGRTLTITPPAGMTEQDIALLCDAVCDCVQTR